MKLLAPHISAKGHLHRVCMGAETGKQSITLFTLNWEWACQLNPTVYSSTHVCNTHKSAMSMIWGYKYISVS